MRGTLLTSLAGFLALGIPAFAADLRVPQNHATIGSALAAAQAGDRVLVAPGTYREHGLILPAGVILAGGGAAPADVVIDGQGAGRLLSCENYSRPSEIRNLTLTGGNASGATVADGSGGAVYCNHAALTIADCIFRGNVAARNGGALWIFEASPTVSGCTFTDNTAGGGGGGVDCTLQSSPSLQNCRFEGNRADWGAGLSCRDTSSPTIISCVFVNNVTQGSRGYGGGTFTDLDSQPTFFACTFAGNEARYGGALANFTDSGATLIRCTLVANRGTWRGGGIYTTNSTPIIKASIVAFQEGPGLFSGGTYGPQVSASDLYGNSGGQWVGSAAPGTIGATNLSRDPLFCPNPPVGSAAFNLQDTSPCHPDSNGGVTLGAWPAGCASPLPSQLTLNAGWNGALAQLTWHVPSDLGSAVTFRLTGARTAEPDTEWDIPFTDDGDGQYTASDPAATVQGEGPFFFRLYASFAGTPWTLLAQTTLTPASEVPSLTQVQAAPNPFNPATTISFRLTREQRVRVSIYDLDGRLVARIADRVFAAGPNAVAWAGQGDNGRELSSGTYLVLVEGPGRQVASKVTLLK